MDPDACLNRIIFLVRKSVTMDAEDHDELLQAFLDLDSWLSNGGFLPRRWER
jgi:hypothetical protein